MKNHIRYDTAKFPRLNLPACNFKVRREDDGCVRLWDTLRKVWLVLTPEEWVRQHVLGMLMQGMSIPPALISQECPVCLNGMPQRADIVVYGKDSSPLMLVECKAPDVAITPAVYAQAVRYNTVLGARYLFLTNGLQHRIYEQTGEEYRIMEVMPDLSGSAGI